MIVDPTTLDLKDLIEEMPKVINFNQFPNLTTGVKPFTLYMYRGASGGYSVRYFWDKFVLLDKPKGTIEMVFGDTMSLKGALVKLYNALVAAGYIT